MRIARTDLVNFMIDDLVESSLGFPKKEIRKRFKKRVKCVILRPDIAFVLLKSILCIINIVDCIVREIYYTYGTCARGTQLQEIKKLRGIAVVYDILAERGGGKERGDKKKKKKELKSQSSTMIFFHS